ncbi:MAG: hypothetical protein LBV62_00895, partial [Rickettsiales bacterium]|nr:hypothetical protein [Rickettsiales bacterium]
VRNTGISFHSIMVSFQCPYDVIPVWNPVFYAISSRTLCFNVRLATFTLTNLIKFLDPSA